MIRSHACLAVSLVAVAALLGGCSSNRDVQITGEAKAPTSGMLSAPITIQFFDEAQTDPKAPPALVVTLEKPGTFDEKLSVNGDKVRIFALSDTNKNGACDSGEAWAQVEADVASDGTVAPVTLSLSTAACPTIAAPASSK
jgi:hypothetical protein